MTDPFEQPSNDAINRFIESKTDPQEREQLSEMFFGENTTMPAGIRQEFQDFVAGEQDSFWKEQRENANQLDPSQMLARIGVIEQKLAIRDAQNLIKETEEDDESTQTDEATNQNEIMADLIRSITGTGYNHGLREKADGSFEMFGRYNGPFYAEPKHNDNLTGDERYSNILRVYKGVVNAGNSVFFWPDNLDFEPPPALPPNEGQGLYRDFKFDHTTLNTSPTSAAGDWFVYIEVAAYPAAPKCNRLFNDLLAQRYTPILRAFRVGADASYPNQQYSQNDHTQADDLAICELSGGGNFYTRTNPRGLDPGEDIICAKFILGVLKLGTNDADPATATRIEKWTPLWHASDIYCPVWQWLHCSYSDGIADYPDTDTLECIYGASLCSPTCFTNWDIFTDHYHKPKTGASWKTSDSDETTFPWEDDCDLDGTGPADNQEGG